MHSDIYEKDIFLAKEIERELKAVNRDRKIDSILKDIEYIPLTVEETDTYKNYMNYYGINSYFCKQIDESNSEYISNQLYLQNKI